MKYLMEHLMEYLMFFIPHFKTEYGEVSENGPDGNYIKCKISGLKFLGCYIRGKIEYLEELK